MPRAAFKPTCSAPAAGVSEHDDPGGAVHASPALEAMIALPVADEKLLQRPR